MIQLSHALVLLLVYFNALPLMVVLLIPTVYIALMGPGAFGIGERPSVDQLTEALATNWREPEELAKYMNRYWVAIQYSASATARQSNCTGLAVGQFLVGVVLLWKGGHTVLAPIVIVEAFILYAMAMRVNRPLSMYKDQTARYTVNRGLRTEWRLAVSSLVAWSEFQPENGNAKYLAQHLWNDDHAREIVRIARTSGWSIAPAE